MSQELRLVAILDLQDNAWDSVKNAVMHCVQETRKEAGNQFYCAHLDCNNHNRIVFIEHWESQEAIDQHCKTKHFNQLLEVVTPYLKNPMDLLTLTEIKS